MSSIKLRTAADPIDWLMFGLGAGLSPWAPGTMGTLLAIPLYLLLRSSPPWVYAIAVLFMFAFGVWASSRAAHRLGDPDPPKIVWDEIVGFQIAMFMAPAGWGYITAGFVLFRLFDITKPFPAAQAQDLPGGYGIMVDDVVAGVYAAFGVQGIAWLTS